jgi:competence protein ComEA
MRRNHHCQQVSPETMPRFPRIFPILVLTAATAFGFPLQPASAVLDLNTATAAQLRALPGMGDAYVHRVIEGRPYTAKNQLVTRGVLPQAAYDKIAPLIIAKRSKA